MQGGEAGSGSYDCYRTLRGLRSTGSPGPVERLAALGAAEGTFDIERMRRLLDHWPQDGWNTHAVQSAYRLALLRGISGGHFLRKSLRAN